MSQTQNFLLVYILPNIVYPLLIALVAILGIARWRRALLMLALVTLALLNCGNRYASYPKSRHSAFPPYSRRHVPASDRRPRNQHKYLRHSCGSASRACAGGVNPRLGLVCRNPAGGDHQRTDS